VVEDLLRFMLDQFGNGQPAEDESTRQDSEPGHSSSELPS
jgi:hypothetical protein